MTTRLAYTKKEAAAVCGVSVDTIVRAVNSGALRAKRSSSKDGKPTGRYLITAKALEAWLDELVDA